VIGRVRRARPGRRGWPSGAIWLIDGRRRAQPLRRYRLRPADISLSAASFASPTSRPNHGRLDRTVAAIAAAHGGRYNIDIHLRHDPNRTLRMFAPDACPTALSDPASDRWGSSVSRTGHGLSPPTISTAVTTISGRLAQVRPVAIEFLPPFQPSGRLELRVQPGSTVRSSARSVTISPITALGATCAGPCTSASNGWSTRS